MLSWSRAMATGRLYRPSRQPGSYWPDRGAAIFHLPEIVMAQLPAELWQVLAFWCLPGNRDVATNKAEAVRFAMAWQLAVTNQERAAQVCFRSLVETKSSFFPGQQLFRGLVEAKVANHIPRPDELGSMFQRSEQGEARWFSDAERFPGTEPHCEIARTWWFSRKMLPWLQREYLAKHFGSYHPLSDHEDDLPYDWDHLPKGRLAAGWPQCRMGADGIHQRDAPQRGNGPTMDDRRCRGQFRLVHFCQNRSDGRSRIFDKMPFLRPGDTTSCLGTAHDFLMDDPVALPFWDEVDRSSRP